MYVAVKGGEKAIAAAHALLARERRGDVQIPEVTLEQLAGQLKLAVDRIMAEGSLYSPELAALAFKQAQAARSWDPPLTIRTACWIAVWPCPGPLPGMWSPKGRRKIWR